MKRIVPNWQKKYANHVSLSSRPAFGFTNPG